MTNSGRAHSRSRVIGLLLALAGVSACGDNDHTINQVTPTGRTVVSAAELTFTHLEEADATAHLLLASSLTKLQQLDAAHDTVGDVSAVSVALVATNDFALAPDDTVSARYIVASFAVRNAATGTPLFEPTHDNLTFVAVSTPTTVAGTPVHLELKADGTPADPAIAQQLVATDVSALDGNGHVVTLAPTVRVALADTALATIALPTDASRVLPYGFLVRGRADFTGMAVTTVPFDGLVTFAFKLPKEPLRANDVSTLSLEFLLVNDPNAVPVKP